jgi:hypothetical protein
MTFSSTPLDRSTDRNASFSAEAQSFRRRSERFCLGTFLWEFETEVLESISLQAGFPLYGQSHDLLLGLRNTIGR